MEQNDFSSGYALYIDAINRSHLSEAAKWARFLAILGFIACGFIFIMSFFIGAIMSRFTGIMASPDMDGFNVPTGTGFGAGLTFLYLLIAVIAFVPYFLLFRFAGKMLLALKSDDMPMMTASFQNLKHFFKFIGIMTIIVLALYVFVLLIVIIAGVAVFG